MAAAVCLSIGTFSIIIWFGRRESPAYLFFAMAALAAAFFALTDLSYYNSETIDELIGAIRWANLSVYGILIGLVWFMYHYFKTARRWLAWTITIT